MGGEGVTDPALPPPPPAHAPAATARDSRRPDRTLRPSGEMDLFRSGIVSPVGRLKRATLSPSERMVNGEREGRV